MPLILAEQDGTRRLTFGSFRVVGREAFRVALFATHAGGWYVYPVSGRADDVEHNHAPAPSGARLSFGDVIRLGGGVRYLVVVATADTPPITAGDDDTVCTVLVGGRAATVRDGLLLVGTGPRCGLRLPPGPAVDPSHALVARVAGRWVLYDLTGRYVRTDDGTPRRFVELWDGCVCTVGDVALEIEIVADGTAAAPPAVDAAAAPEPDLDEDLPEAEELHDDDPPPAAGLNDTVAVTADSPTGEQGDPFRADAERVCGWLRAALKATGGPPPAPVLPPPTSFLRGVVSGEANFCGLLHDVVRAPSRADVLNRFATALDRRGHPDLCRQVLRRLFFLDQSNVEVARALAASYLTAGQETTAKVDRVKLLEEANRYWQKACEAGGRDDALVQLGLDIGGELAGARLARIG